MKVTLKMSPVPEPFAKVYRRRGMEPPMLSSAIPGMATMPYRFRRLHKAYATANGYFWALCILCRREYGGHEITDSIPDPVEGEGRRLLICPVCTAERNGGVA